MRATERMNTSGPLRAESLILGLLEQLAIKMRKGSLYRNMELPMYSSKKLQKFFVRRLSYNT